jgi:hypothetical protein
MPRKKSPKKKKTEKAGIETIVEPGVGALYVRGTWRKKLKDLAERKQKRREKRR